MKLPILNMRDQTDRRKWSQLLDSLRQGVGPGGEDLRAAVNSVIDEVASGGDAALARLTERLDGVKLAPSALRVEPEELARAKETLDAGLLDSLRRAAENVRRYHRHIMPTETPALRREGTWLQMRWVPLERVGVYVPGGKAAYPSTVLMTVIPAQVAGVREIAVFSPPGKETSLPHPAVLATLELLGVSEVYRIGGTQGVAGLALGTRTIRRVDKIVGPGNNYVQAAKRELFGRVDIDSFAGPSEVVVLADKSASAAHAAAELLAQAEHDPGSAILITTSEPLARETCRQVESQSAGLSRAEAIGDALARMSAVVVCTDLDEAIGLTEEAAPEHLVVLTEEARETARRIRSAGTIFIGPFSPVAAGDYWAGPSHVLPTSGTARFFSGLSVFDFLRRTSLVELDHSGLAEAAPHIIRLAQAEGLDAHAASVAERFK